MRSYELAVVMHPDLEIDLAGAHARLEKLVTDAGGKVVGKSELGKQKLAYPVKKENFGIYAIYELELEPTKVAELETGLLLAEEVLRHLLTIPGPVVEASAEEVAPKAEKEDTKPKAKAKKTTVKKESK